MRKCGLYVRVSTLRQAEIKEGSLANQEYLLRQQIKCKNGLGAGAWDVTEVYREEGKSAKNTTARPEFLRMMEDLKAGVINTVMVTALSRISRSTRDLLEMIETFKKYGVDFISLKEDFDTTTAQGKCFVTIVAALNEFEREQTSERNRASALARAERGLWNGGQVLGYDLPQEKEQKGTLLKNEREAAIVNNEIRRVRSAPGYLESEAFVAEIGPLAETEKPVTLPPGERLAELQPLRRRYEEQLAATESDFSRQQNLWPEKYLQALNQLMMEFQNAGDFSGWESARNEIDRFEMDRLLLPGQLATEPPRLLETQRQHLTLLQGYREARARGIINLAETQIKTLAELQSKYTKAGDMASAGEINAEIRRIRNAPEVQAAQNELNPPPAPETDAPTNAAAHPHT